MKPFILFAFVALVLVHCASGSNDHETTEDTYTISTANKMNITIGNRTFTATLTDNETAKTFKSMLPMTLIMKELNNNEKYADLPGSLPANAAIPAKIQTGDLMLYGSSTLVLFYKTFSTSYSYTRLGSMDDVSGLVEALGKGNVKISFELQ